MLVKSESLTNVPVMSLQTGGELARTKKLLVDPRNLKVVAYELSGHALTVHPSFLIPTDIREVASMGIIVDSGDEFVGEDDVLLVKDVYGYGFSLIGLEVFDEKKHKLGKINEYNLEVDSLTVEQINIRRPLLKSLSDTELLIHRSQIVKVDSKFIIVKSADSKSTTKRVSDMARSYANPFRSQNPQTESADIDWPGTDR